MFIQIYSRYWWKNKEIKNRRIEKYKNRRRIWRIFAVNIIKQSFWEILAKAKEDKPIILYGMGNGADKILNFCAGKNIKITDIFASDEFVREHFFRGFKVKSLTQIKEIYGNHFCILLSFASRADSVINKIYDLNDRHELYIPNFPVFGENNYFDYDYYVKNQKDIEQVYQLLADEESKKNLENAVNFFITGKLEYLALMESPKKSALDLLELDDCEDLSYIDLGAYDGDTIFEMLDYYNNKNTKSIKKIYAFEPDKKNFAKLKKT
jgi:hypothetical protein